MKKRTIKEQVIELLKHGWYSNFQMNMILQTSCADREMRRIRKNPPQGLKVMQRQKIMPDGYNRCLEYSLKREDYNV